MLRNILISGLFLLFYSNLFADVDTARKAFEAGDYETAYGEFLRLAEAGDAKAQDYLGWMYRNGVGITQNYDKAVMWYRKAAEQGETNALFNLGKMYEEGFGVQQDYAEAFKWYHAAAKSGQVHAQFNLAEMYLDGIGVEQDYVQAYAWIGVVAASGIESAETLREEIEFEMSPEQLEEARNLGKVLWEKYGDKSKNKN